MNRRKLSQLVIGVMLVILFVVGCGAPATTPTSEVPTATFTPEPLTATPTPIPPTVTPTPSGPEEISWKDARANIGTTAKVCGEAVTVAILLDGRTVVNLGETPDKGGVIVVVTDSTIFPEDEIKDLYGKNICVTGEITQEGSNIGIFVTDPAQIEMNE